MRLTLLACLMGVFAAAFSPDEKAWYRYEDGKPRGGVVRIHEVRTPGATGEVYAYATFYGIEPNPGSYEGDQPRGQQIVSIGEQKGERFIPAVRFGVANNKDFLQ